MDALERKPPDLYIISLLNNNMNCLLRQQTSTFT